MSNKESKDQNATQAKLTDSVLHEINKLEYLNLPIPVTIEFAEEPQPHEPMGFEELIAFLNSELDRLQTPIVTKLIELGIDPKSVERTPLSSTLNIVLMATDIYAIANLKEVKMIRYNGDNQKIVAS